MNIKKSLPVIIGFIILSIIFFKSYQGSLIRKKADTEFYKNFNESFNGRITKIVQFEPETKFQSGKEYTYVYLKLSGSSIRNINILQNCFFIIKQDTAILILNTFRTERMKIGDYLLFDGKVDTLYYYKTGYYDLKVYKDYEIINFPYEEATKLLPKNSKVIEKWQPSNLKTRAFIAKRLDVFNKK